MLFNEPKLLKSGDIAVPPTRRGGFSALQRAEIAEMQLCLDSPEILRRFSALQRAEIAEMLNRFYTLFFPHTVSVLFNEPKLLKSPGTKHYYQTVARFSALQRAEIAEMRP